MQSSGNPAIHRVAYRWQGCARSTISTPAGARRGAARLPGRGGRPRRTLRRRHVHHLTGMSTAARVLEQAGIPVVLTLHDYWLACPRARCSTTAGSLRSARGGALRRVPAVDVPGLAAHRQRHRRGRALHRRAGELLALPRRLVVPSARVLPPFLQLGIARERFTVVENGVDTQALRSLPPAPCGPAAAPRLPRTLLRARPALLVDALLAQRPGTARLDIFATRRPTTATRPT